METDVKSDGAPPPNTELAAMLRSLQPMLMEGAFAFCRFGDSKPIPESAVGWFREKEGLTVVLPLADAAGRTVDFEAAWIALGVESSLSSVGLTAAISKALADAGIACNVVAACRHDHLFVPRNRAAEAMEILTNLSEKAMTAKSDLKTEDNPTPQFPKRDPNEGFGCFVSVVVMSICSAAMVLFISSEKTDKLGAGIGVCGLAALGVGVVYIAAHRRG